MLLPLTTLHSSYKVTHPFRVPYHAGSMLRGVLGRSLRSVACTSDPTCAAACATPDGCAYSRLFDPPSRPNSQQAARFGASSSPPPPLIPLIPITGGQLLEPGDEVAFGLRCLGNLPTADADVLLSALERLDERALADEGGRVRFVSAGFAGHRGRVLEIGESPPRAGRATITFETPAWLAHDKHLALDLDFPNFFRAAWRRLSVLAELYGEHSTSDDETFRRLDAIAAGVATISRDLRPLRWERRSDESGKRHKMEGLAGAITFAGPVGAFGSVLAAAEQVHVGKSTSFGLGRIRASFDD